MTTLRLSFVIVTLFLLCLALYSCLYYQTSTSMVETTITETGITKNIYIDDSFSINEEDSIRGVLLSWEKASNNKIKLNYAGKHYEPGELDDYFHEKSFNRSIFIWRENTSGLSWYMKNRLERFSGVYDLNGNIVILMDHINNIDTLFQNVVKHEVGHALGLEHSTTGRASVMRLNSNEIADCITEEDAERLCALYFCEAKPECNL